MRNIKFERALSSGCKVTDFPSFYTILTTKIFALKREKMWRIVGFFA